MSSKFLLALRQMANNIMIYNRNVNVLVE